MEGELIEIYVYAGGRSEVVQAAPVESLREILIGQGLIGAAGAELLTFVGECDDALAEAVDAEDGSDTDLPVNIDLSIEILGLRERRHVHCHPCRHIAVVVNFGGASKRRRFSPSATVETVTSWARRKFPIDAAAASEYVLQFCGSTVQPRTDQHLSQLPEATACALCFDLVPEVTPQG